MGLFLQLSINTLIPACILALVAAGFSLIYSVSRIQHLAHGGVVIAAAYAFFWAQTRLHLGLAASVILTIICAMALGAAIHMLVYERLRNSTAIATAGSLTATLSLLLILQYGLLAVFGSDTKSLPELGADLQDFGPVTLSGAERTLLILAPLLLIALAIFLRASRTGKAMRAVAEHETVAEVVGIPARRMRLLAILIGSTYAGIAGIFYIIEYALEPSMTSTVAVRMFFRAILGGVGSVPGAMLGAVLSDAISQLTTWHWSQTWADFAVFFVTFLVLLVRPEGLLSTSRRRA